MLRFHTLCAFCIGNIVKKCKPAIVSVSAIDETFYIFTREHPNVPVLVQTEEDFDVEKPTKFLIHGWLGSAIMGYDYDLKDSFLKKLDCVVIIVDWTKSAGEYWQSVQQSILYGKVLGEFIVKNFKSFENVHLVGLGLGAQLAGFAGKEVFKSTGDKVSRITGLDPTLPRFDNASKSERLDVDDAYFVDVYHCDGYRFAFGDPIGTVDFYPNGGIAPMPGCKDVNQTLLDFMYMTMDKVFCSRRLCRRYFSRSINNDNEWQATKCSSWQTYLDGLCSKNENVTFGYDVLPNATGKYYLNISNYENPSLFK